MRTTEEWENKNYPKVFEEFTPRLQQDILKHVPTTIPAFGGYYIFGAPSTGKTTLAAHMYIEARKKKYFERLPGAFKFVNTYDFFQELKKSFDSPETGEDVILAEYSAAAYLVLDDIGSTKMTDWAISMLQIVINNRYEQLLPTVFTSNLDLDQLADAMDDERIPSRIRRMGKLIKKK